MNSVLQDWVMELPLRAQGTLLTGIRGCDVAPKTSLAEQGHPLATELKKKADEFDKNAADFYAEPQACSTEKFMGSWARARKLWCQCTGEPLV